MYKQYNINTHNQMNNRKIKKNIKYELANDEKEKDWKFGSFWRWEFHFRGHDNWILIHLI